MGEFGDTLTQEFCNGALVSQVIKSPIPKGYAITTQVFDLGRLIRQDKHIVFTEPLDLISEASEG